MAESHYDSIVIGAGITGLAAARQAAQSGLRTAFIEPMMFGGLIVNIRELDLRSGASAGRPESGIEFASRIMMEAADAGAANLRETVTGIARRDGALEVTTDAGHHSARSVIVASGARLRKLGVPGEAEFEGRGVSQCADCDGPMFKQAVVVVVGGGDSALQEALVLSRFCARIYLVNRGTGFRARRHLVDAVLANPSIEPLWNTVVTEVCGNKESGVTGVRVSDNRTGQSRTLECAGLFPWIGLEPVCDFATPEVEHDGAGFLVTDTDLRTTLPGVYAAGAVRSGYGGLIALAMSEGVHAARSSGAALRHRVP